MLSSRLTGLILAAARRPWLTVALALGALLAALIVTVTRFDMTTDTGQLISAKTPWRQDEAAVEQAFPQTLDAFLIIVDGQTPELAEDGAKRLAEALAADKAHFTLVKRPDGGDFLAREGLLFADLADVRSTTQRLVDAQPLLGPLASDPGLHGVASAIDTAATGALTESDPARTAQLAAPMAGLARAITRKLDEPQRPVFFSWTRLIAPGSGALAAPTRRLVLAQPVLDFSDLQPGSAAAEAIRKAAQTLALDPAHGVQLGVTGEIPLADEEFGTIRENIGWVGALMAAAMVLTLFWGVRSGKIVLAIVTTIVAGLGITLGLGLLAVGRLNLISVAFIPLFVGLGVDFGIQVSVRFNAERRAGHAPLVALERAGKALGEPLLLAAAAIVLALFAFLPTDYVGIAELGVIAAIGMVVALVLNLTLLPALLVLLAPPPPAKPVGWAGAAPIDRWLVRHRGWVLGAFVAAMLATVAGLAWVRFDFNPLHLRDPHTPGMQALARLLEDPERTPNTLSVLASDVAAADAMAAKLAKLPEVGQAITVSSFVPADQPAKLALIQDASLLLDPAINPFDLPQPADDATTLAVLAKAQASLKALATARPGELGTSAARLATAFARLAAAPPATRAAVSDMLAKPLATTLDTIRAMLQAGPVTRADLPPEIAGDWVAKDGRALVSLTPRGNSLDNTVLTRFAAAVRSVAPHATGMPVATQEAARTVAGAFVRAGVLALALVSVLLWLVLRSVREVAFTLAPVVLSGFLTLGTCVVIGQPLNFANIIAFPLLFGVGVAFHIYFVMAWRRGVSGLLQTSLARAVLASALATGTAFGALWFSDHPGTASMGLILMMSLVWTLICALIFEPALLGPVEHGLPEGELE